MSLGTSSAANLRAGSPLGAGRNSPGIARLRQHDEDGTLKKDKGFRRYSAGVDRVLASFETGIVEWADYISFLARLQKALAAQPTGSTEVAHKTLVAKRLSQCLSPGLPSGVHQKAIEVYGHIFQAYGRDGLSANLSIYLPGLSPVLSFASLSVRPNVLSLYEKYIVNLNAEALRPALKALILTFLPALEEASGEDFERCLQLLDRLRERIAEPESTGQDKKGPSDQFFWQCLFLACISSAMRRPGVLVFLTRRLPILGQPLQTLGSPSLTSETNSQRIVEQHALDEAIASVASPEPGLLIRCFCAGLRDEQILVQRGFLDLLVTHLPLHSTVLQQLASGDDMEKLVAAATAVVARRDMSLNRRLWAWFLGPEPPSENLLSSALSPTSPQSVTSPTPRIESISDQVQYFEQNGLRPLIGSLKTMISAEPKSPGERARPLRVCLSLMDRWDIGGLVVPRIFIPALKSAWAYQNLGLPKEAQSEVLRSANMFFDSVESGLIWSEVFKLLEDALTIREARLAVSLEKLEFLLFIISKFNVREEEMQVVHMPVVCLYALLHLPSWESTFSKSPDKDAKAVIIVTLKILVKLIELIPSRALKSERRPSGETLQGRKNTSEQDIISGVRAFYNNNRGNIGDKKPMAEEDVGQWLLWAAVRNVSQILKKCLGHQAQVDLSVSLLGLILRKGPQRSSNFDELLKELQHIEEEAPDSNGDEGSFAVALSKVSVLETILTTSHSVQWISNRTLRQIVPQLTEQIWPGLSPSRLKNNVEAARGIWKLQSASPDSSLVESTVTTMIIPSLKDSVDEISQLEGARRFEILWMHSPVTSTGGDYRRASMPRTQHDLVQSNAYFSELFMLERPLILMIDNLEDSKGPLFLFVVNWLQSLPSLVPILRTLFTRLGHEYQRSTGHHPISARATTPLADEADLSMHLYYLQRLLNILQLPSTNVWSSLARPNTLMDSDEESDESYFTSLVSISMSTLMIRTGADPEQQLQLLKLKQCALAVLEQCILSILGEKLRGKDLEKCLLDELQQAVQEEQHSLQIAIMDVLFSTLKLTSDTRSTPPPSVSDSESRQESPRPGTETHQNNEKSSSTVPLHSNIPPSLLECLVLGIRSKSTRPILENWIAFLGHCLPLYRHSVFQVLLPLVSCFCSTLEVVLSDLRDTFSASKKDDRSPISEPTIALLLNGLEQTLATAHEQLTAEEAHGSSSKAAEPQQTGFFGGMVPGVFGTDATRSKTSAGNRRLTVLLCFKDAIRIAFQLWSWGDSTKDASLRDISASLSFSYVTLRLRNRTRRLFEHLFAVEPLECLETLVEAWQRVAMEDSPTEAAAVLNLINALESSRPKNAIPAIFNAIYSRTNPTALEPSRKSTLTSEITDTSFAAFLVAYARSLDDDAMDEIWTDCVTFLRDVLANPMPHRQVLSKLVEFTSILGKKAENTNFGEQRRMRRELGDLFNRLLTATLTIRPSAYASDDRQNTDTNSSRPSLDSRPVLGSESLVSVLATIGPDLPKILGDTDRLASTANVISTQVILPIFRARAFPENINSRTLDLVKALSTIPEASRSFKRDVGEAYNDSKFFSCSYELIKDGWMPILRAWTLVDKDRMPDLLSRLPYPSSAGLFGVGANSARLEADRKTQLNLRRIALLMLSSSDDSFSAYLQTLQQKLVDLLRATADSSPSSRTRAEVYMVMRALILRTNLSHLSSFWPTMYSELADALSAAYPPEAVSSNTGPGTGEGGGDGSDADGSHQNPQAPIPVCLLQACKLLDTLLVLGIDDFQLHEWLFISDTTDAMYRPESHFSVALADDLAEALDAGDRSTTGTTRSYSQEEASDGGTYPLLAGASTRDTPSEKLIETVVRPFLRQLSIQAFESTYGMYMVDKEACEEDLLADIAAEGTIV